jgi:hypothetical protein
VRASLQALAVARSSEADDAILAVYLHGLSDLETAHVQLACERLSRKPREAYQSALPDVGTIRAEAALVAREQREHAERRMLAPTPHDADPRSWVYCVNCLDTSWHSFRCDGGTGDTGDRDSHLKRVHCGRRNGHSMHTYAERCACYSTNPVIARRRERRQESAA